MFDYEQRWGQVHSAVLNELCDSFNDNKIKFFILRNYEGLPEHNSSKDVDIIIRPGSYRVAVKLLKSAYSKHGFDLIDIVRYDRVRCCFGFNITDGLSIHIDLIENFVHYGVRLFDFDFLYAHTLEYKNFRVLCQDIDAVLLLYYKLFAAKEIYPKYQTKISEAWTKRPKEIEEYVRILAGKDLGARICELISAGSYADLGKMTTAISRKAKWRVFWRTPLKSAWGIFSWWCQNFVKVVICPYRQRKFISVMGPDGVGKSTFIDLLEKRINHYYVSETKCKIYHHRPTLLPNLAAVGEKMGAGKADVNFSSPHRGVPTGFLSSMIRMTYYWLDYVIGVPLIVRKNIRGDYFTVFDRYIYDFIVDPLRTRIKLPGWIRRVYAALVPHPRLVFILHADAEIVYARKQELPKDEIVRQLAECRRLAGSGRRFVLLDASQKPEQMAEQAIQHILREFAKRI